MAWGYLVEKATVNRDGSVSFLFRNVMLNGFWKDFTQEGF
jgi:hypothetical protein